MAAATQTNLGVISHVPYVVHKVRLSSLTSGQTEDVAYSSPTAQADLKASPAFIHAEVSTPPATNEQVVVERVVSSDSASGSTAAVKVIGEAGGDLTSCVVDVFMFFLDQARQDGQSISQDNNT